MIQPKYGRSDPKRTQAVNKKKQFADATSHQHDYLCRLSFYEVPPTAEITLEQFERWAIDRLRGKDRHNYAAILFKHFIVLAELEACSFRNRTPQETATHMAPILEKYLPLQANSSSSARARDERIREERQKDHYSHYILRLAFSSTEDLRNRFARVESSLFRLRFQSDNVRERQSFIETLNFDWEKVPEEERNRLSSQMTAASPVLKRSEQEDGTWFKVEWEKVPELVEGRKVLVSKGKAYVPSWEQTSLVLAEFHARLQNSLQVRTPAQAAEGDVLTLGFKANRTRTASLGRGR